MDEFKADFNFFKLPDSVESPSQSSLPKTPNEPVPKSKGREGAKEANSSHNDEAKRPEDTKSQISSTSEDSSLRIPGLDGWRQRIRELLVTTPYQLVVVVLVVTDMMLVVGQLMLDLQGAHHMASLSLHYMSLVLLSIFCLEILVKLFAYQLEFFSHKFEMFDAVVVIVAFILDIIYLDANDAHSGLGLIIILRLWRLVRIQNAMMAQVRRVEEKKLHREQQHRMAVEEDLQQCRAYVATLQQRLNENNIPFDVERRNQGSTMFP